MNITEKDRAELAALYSAYRRAFGRTSLQALLAKHGIDENLDALEQQDKFLALHKALVAGLPPDAIAQAKAHADGANVDDDVDNDDGATASRSSSATGAAKPRALGDLTAEAYRTWNNPKRGGHG